MPKGNYPDDHKHIAARGLSMNKYDTKGNLRKKRKTRAKNPERFKESIKEKTGLENIFEGSLLGKIVDKGIATGDIDSSVASYTAPKEQVRKRTTYGPNPYHFRYYEEDDARPGYPPIKIDRGEAPIRRITKERRDKTEPVMKVEDLGAKHVVNDFYSSRTFRHKNKYIIPAKDRKALRDHIKKNYGDEYGIGRDGILKLRTRDRPKTQEEKDEIAQQKADAHNKQIDDLFNSIGQAPVDRNANVSLEQANISMKIAEVNKPQPPPPPNPEQMRQDVIQKATSYIQTQKVNEALKKIQVKRAKGYHWSHLSINSHLVHDKVLDDPLRWVDGIEVKSQPKMGNPLPKAQQKPISAPLATVDEASEPEYMMDSDETDDSDFGETVAEEEPYATPTKSWTDWVDGYAKGWPKGMKAKESKFLTLSEAKEEAKKRGDIVKAITKQMYGKRMMYTLRGSSQIKNDGLPYRKEQTIVYA